MGVLRRGRVRIRYRVRGAGFPVLALAPGGLRSTGSRWAEAPWDPVTELADRYRVITMDQRNAGGSTAPITGTEGWPTYTGDQLALLDHLGVRRAHVVGMGVGATFALSLLRAAPGRVVRAVLLQPIGLDGGGGNRADFQELFDDWKAEVERDHPETDHNQWNAYRANLFGGINQLFSVPPSFLATVTAPLLVPRGDDTLHPASASEFLAAAVPGARLVERWRDPEHLAAGRAAITEFLGAGQAAAGEL